MTSREDARAFVDQWRRAGAALRHVEREELQHVDVAVTIRAFSGAVVIAAAADPARATSGLVEFQRLVARLRR